MKINVTIQGTSPLLQARHPSPEEEAEILKRAKSAKKTKNLTDEEAYEMHAYKNKAGKFIQPAEMIEAAMVKAAVSFTWKGKKTYKDIMKGGVVVDPVEIVHKNQQFEMFSKWGVNSTTRGAIWVVRPRINEWELTFTIDIINSDQLDDRILKDILEYAGTYIGIGAWRPKFGRFKVIKFEEVK